MSKAILISLMCSCVLSLTSLPAVAQDKKDSATSTETHKNTDGTTTTTERYDGGSKATTKDSAGKLIDTVTTERSDRFGKGGTKAKIESHTNGNDIDTVVYRDKAGNIRRAEKIEFTETGKNTFDADYDESGRLTSFARGRNNNINREGKVEYDELGRPSAVLVNHGLTNNPDREQYRMTYKYDGANDKTGGQTMERYDRYTKKWIAVKLSTFDEMLEAAAKLLAASRKATERQISIIGDISPINPPDMEAPKQKKDTGKFDPCLVGTWRSEPGDGGVYGNGGIVLTIKPDGMATFDYDGMKPWVRQLGGGNTTIKVTGKASGQISSEGNKSLSVPGNFTSGVTEKETSEDGTYREFKPGGFFPSGAQGSEYTCTKDTLTLFANMKFKKVE